MFKIGEKTSKTRLKPGLLQDIILEYYEDKADRL